MENVMKRGKGFMGIGILNLMKRHLMSITIIIVGVLFLTTISYAKNKYDVMLKNEGIQKQINYYETKVKKSPLIMDYLNAIVSSPKSLYKALDEHDCDKEILAFVKENKSFTLKLVHMRIAIVLGKLNVNDKQLMFVTNYIKSPRAMAATNAQEMGMETMYMREMPAFKLYEVFTAPGGFKEQVEDIFHSVVK